MGIDSGSMRKRKDRDIKALGIERKELFCANSECTPIANIRYWHGQRANKRHSLLAVPIANRRNYRSNSDCCHNSESLR